MDAFWNWLLGPSQVSRQLGAIDAKLAVLERYCHDHLRFLAKDQFDLAMLSAQSWRGLNERLVVLEQWANEVAACLKRQGQECTIRPFHPTDD